MKLAAIYNVWDGVELLKGSINCIKDHVDMIFIIYQRVSNFGEQYDPIVDLESYGMEFLADPSVVFHEYKPSELGGAINERAKRNIGIDLARENGCTHFLHLDCDEYYKNFGEAKRMYIDSGKAGSVCKLFTYFKSPEYRFQNADGYYVPFIHQLKPNTIAGVKGYPFYVDPTRGINEHAVTELPIFMHHFSWVRKNIGRKINNSSARKNILKGSAMEDYNNPFLLQCPEQYYVKDFDQRLTVVDNYFNIHI